MVVATSDKLRVLGEGITILGSNRANQLSSIAVGLSIDVTRLNISCFLKISDAPCCQASKGPVASIATVTRFANIRDIPVD